MANRHVPGLFSWLMWGGIAALTAVPLCMASLYAPNHFLGTCLNSTWVTETETKLGISSKQRNADGRLTYPFLQAALKHRRYQVDFASAFPSRN